MNNKIPCGGFYLSDTLGVDENGKLGVSGGEPYKSLVTDGEGGVKWEDRLAYVATEEQVIFSQEDVAFTDTHAQIVSPFGKLIIGNEYTVIWDGVTYENLTAFDDGGLPTIGSPRSSISEALPFSISTVEAPGSILLLVSALTSDNTHSVTIFGPVETVHKIPLAYLPEKTKVYVSSGDDDMYFDSETTKALSAEDFISAVNSVGVDFIELPISSNELHLQMINYSINKKSGTVTAYIAEVSVDGSTINIMTFNAQSASAPS